MAIERDDSMTALSSAFSQSTISTSSVFIEVILINHLIYDFIFSCCPPASILRTSRTCRTAYAAVKSYILRAYNINRQLSRYFSDVPAFRSLQARTGSLISGSTALQFFDRSSYSESDLDIYVHPRWRRHVGRWLIREGYVFVPNDRQASSFEVAASDPRVISRYANYIMRGVSAVFTFVKRTTSGERRKVQLVAACRTPIEVILCFHSTCVMNVISYNKAVSLYPRATLEERRALICATDKPGLETALEKYGGRGWEMLRVLPPSERNKTNRSFRLGSRWLEDGDSWVIPLDTTGVASPRAMSPSSAPLMQDPVSITTWELGLTIGASGITIFSFLNHPTGLFYQYVMQDAELEGVMRRVIGQRIEGRPEALRTHSSSSEVTYFDASVLNLCRAILQDQQQLGLRP